MDYKIILIIILIIAIIFLIYLFKKNNEKVEDKKDNKYVNLKKNNLGKELVKKTRNIDMPLYTMKFNPEKVNPYFDIFIGDRYSGKIVFELIDDIVPKTCMNFRYLCSKNFHNNKQIGVYQSKYIDSVEKDSCIKFGSNINYSVYGKKFEDENFELKHNQPGILSMDNSGKDTNNSKIIINLKKQPQFDNKHVVFGILISGYEVLEEINNLELNENGVPLQKCKIVKCGLMGNA